MPSVRQKMKFDVLNGDHVNIHARTHGTHIRRTTYAPLTPKDDDQTIDMILKMSCHFHWLHIRNSFFVGARTHPHIHVSSWVALYSQRTVSMHCIPIYVFDDAQPLLFDRFSIFFFFRSVRMWIACAPSKCMRHTNMSLKVSNQYGIVHCDVAIDVVLVALKSIQMICFPFLVLLGTSQVDEANARSAECVSMSIFEMTFVHITNTNSKQIKIYRYRHWLDWMMAPNESIHIQIANGKHVINVLYSCLGPFSRSYRSNEFPVKKLVPQLG